MPIAFVPQVAILALLGVAAGLWLLVRGMAGYRDATRIGDTATSRIATLAAGEVQVSGVIEPAELTLISPLQSITCVYYRSTIDGAGDASDVGDASGDLGADLREERAVGFRVRDPSGSIRIFPRGARWDAPVVLDDTTDVIGDAPPALRLRTGPAIAGSGLGREAAIEALLATPAAQREFRPLTILAGSGGASFAGRDRPRRYREAILAPGDAVTIIGRALPFSDLSDPAEADIAVDSTLPSDDPEVVGDIAEAREAGLLEATPEEAWGNAAIPGFGIGRPVRTPELEAGANRLPLATAAQASAAERTFTIAPETLVLASAPGTPLLVVHGVPDVAVERQQGRFLVGLLGAVLAIGSAMALAMMLARGLGS